MKTIMISRRAKQCGVNDYGRRLWDILYTGIMIDYVEVDSLLHYKEAVIGYDIILYNYHYATLDFIKDDRIDRSQKHYAIYHEAHMHFTPDKIIDTSVRPLFEQLMPTMPDNPIPTIGSFGFGFPDKNFPGIAEVVKEQFDTAVIRLNIPFAEYGDRDGQLAKREVEKVRGILKGTNIELGVNHDYLHHQDLLSFLRGNDINLFLYKQSHGRGLSSAIDYALSVRRPIGVSDSEMFRHLPVECRVGDIRGIMNGDVLQPVYEQHSNKKLIERFKEFLV